MSIALCHDEISLNSVRRFHIQWGLVITERRFRIGVTVEFTAAFDLEDGLGRCLRGANVKETIVVWFGAIKGEMAGGLIVHVGISHVIDVDGVVDGLV